VLLYFDIFGRGEPLEVAARAFDVIHPRIVAAMRDNDGFCGLVLTVKDAVKLERFRRLLRAAIPYGGYLVSGLIVLRQILPVLNNKSLDR
jgi:hypothetical protein